MVIGKEDTNLTTTTKKSDKMSMENQDLKHHRKRWEEAIQGGGRMYVQCGKKMKKMRLE